MNEMKGDIKMENDVFYDQLKMKDGQLYITIPLKLQKFSDFKKGDQVKIMIIGVKKP
jgi:hypothetical protein